MSETAGAVVGIFRPSGDDSSIQGQRMSESHGHWDIEADVVVLGTAAYARRYVDLVEAVAARE